MKTQINHTSSIRKDGFSLFEVLMFVAIIGIMVAMVVPMLGNNDAFYAARDRRNAQELVSTSVVAQAAGLNFVEGNSVLDILRAVSRGRTVSKGPMKGHNYSVPGLSEEDLKGASKYVTLGDGSLQYSFNSVELKKGGTNL
jgi:competence protein ComGC